MTHTTDTRQAVAAEVRASLARAGRSATWLAEHSGVPKSSLAPKLRGDRSFSVEELVAVMGALEVAPSAILGAPRVAA